VARSLLACLGLLVAAGASGSADRAAAREFAQSVTFLDATAEDPKAPDITAVVVSNSDAVWEHDGRPLARPSSVLTLRIEVPNRPVLTSDMRMDVWIDADDDPTTGFTAFGQIFRGADYLISWHPNVRADAGLVRCDASTCVSADARTFRFSYAGGSTFSVLASELGNTRRFRFAARVSSGIVLDEGGGIDPTNAGRDFAPEAGTWWRYAVRIRPARLVVEEFSTSPARPRAGRPLTVRLTARRNDNGALISSGRVVCTARVDDLPLRPRSQRFVGRRATCVFALPEDAAGKAIRGTITIVSSGLRVTKSFARRIP
jgi:hypothetical protein